jgi:hypothetical protein
MITRAEMVDVLRLDGVIGYGSACAALDGLLALIDSRGCQIVPKVATESALSDAVVAFLESQASRKSGRVIASGGHPDDMRAAFAVLLAAARPPVEWTEADAQALANAYYQSEASGVEMRDMLAALKKALPMCVPLPVEPISADVVRSDNTTAAIVAWMRRRAEPVAGDNNYARAWRAGVADMADEIEANAREQCGHAATESEQKAKGGG